MLYEVITPRFPFIEPFQRASSPAGTEMDVRRFGPALPTNTQIKGSVSCPRPGIIDYPSSTSSPLWLLAPLSEKRNVEQLHSIAFGIALKRNSLV